MVGSTRGERRASGGVRARPAGAGAGRHQRVAQLDPRRPPHGVLGPGLDLPLRIRRARLAGRRGPLGGVADPTAGALLSGPDPGRRAGPRRPAGPRLADAPGLRPRNRALELRAGRLRGPRSRGRPGLRARCVVGSRFLRLPHGPAGPGLGAPAAAGAGLPRRRRRGDGQLRLGDARLRPHHAPAAGLGGGGALRPRGADQRDPGERPGVAAAGGAGPQRERGALPRAQRQRLRPGRRDGSGRALHLRQSTLRGMDRHPQRRADRNARGRPGAPRGPRAHPRLVPGPEPVGRRVADHGSRPPPRRRLAMARDQRPHLPRGRGAPNRRDLPRRHGTHRAERAPSGGARPPRGAGEGENRPASSGGRQPGGGGRGTAPRRVRAARERGALAQRLRAELGSELRPHPGAGRLVHHGLGHPGDRPDQRPQPRGDRRARMAFHRPPGRSRSGRDPSASGSTWRDQGVRLPDRQPGRETCAG